MTQHRSSPIRRREFLSSVGGLAAVSFLGSAGGAEAPPATAKAKIRGRVPELGFHGLGPAADPEPAIDLIGGMGFDGFELILTASNDIKTFWTDGRIGSLKSKLARRKLQVSQFAVFQPVVEGLSSTERDERERALDHFEAGCRIAAKLGRPS